MRQRSGLCVVALLAICTIAGCGGGGGTQPTGSEWVVGQWGAHSLSLSASGVREALRDYGIVGRFDVSADGTYRAYKYEPGEGERCSVGTWEYRGNDAWLFSNSTYGGTSMLFRRGGELYETGALNGQQVWLWYRRTDGALPICPPAIPSGVTSCLFQSSPGDVAAIRVSVQRGTLPIDPGILAWLFYRASGSGSAEFPPDSLVGRVIGERLPGSVWDDGPEAIPPLEVSEDLPYTTAIGTGGSVEVDVTINHQALEAGQTYQHCVQWVTEPRLAAAGTGVASPASTGLHPITSVASVFRVQPPEALSSCSDATAPLTYFTPPSLQMPSDGAQNQSTSSLTFRWSSTAGADEYVVQVFPEDDPDGIRTPRYSVAVDESNAGTMSRTISDSFASSSRFYWRVGARRSGEARPENGRLNQRGWLFSDIRTFTTAAAPPPPAF